MSVDTVEFNEDPSGPDAPMQQEAQGDRPEGLPEKFETVADLASSYKELEQKLGGGEDYYDESPEDVNRDAVEMVEDAIGAETFEQYSNEYFENGNTLSEDSYKELQEKYNFSPELVDSFIQGQEALAENEVARVTEVVGGMDKYQEIMEWAQNNVPEEEIDAYNNTVLEGDTGSVRLALQGLYAKYASENGIEPSLVQGGGRARAAGYESRQQMIEDMKRPEYKEDPAFREQVERRLANTHSSVI